MGFRRAALGIVATFFSHVLRRRRRQNPILAHTPFTWSRNRHQKHFLQGPFVSLFVSVTSVVWEWRTNVTKLSRKHYNVDPWVRYQAFLLYWCDVTGRRRSPLIMWTANAAACLHRNTGREQRNVPGKWLSQLICLLTTHMSSHVLLPHVCGVKSVLI